MMDDYRFLIRLLESFKSHVKVLKRMSSRQFKEHSLFSHYTKREQIREFNEEIKTLERQTAEMFRYIQSNCYLGEHI